MARPGIRFNPFHDNLGNPDIKFRSASDFASREHTSAFKELTDHMIEISDDPSGSNPEEYLAPEDVETLHNFWQLAEDLGWPEASTLTMRKGRSSLTLPWTAYSVAYGGLRRGLHRVTKNFKNYSFGDYDPARRTDGKRENVPIWVKPQTTAIRGLTKAAISRRTGESHKGYIFARLGFEHPTQLVAFCDDGKLRSLRGRELSRSYALGWGRLPDAELVEPVLASGRTHGVDIVNYGSKSLSRTLLLHIDSNLIKDSGIDIADYDLVK